MKTILALAAATLLACAAPAFAQSAGAPGATGTGGSLTGSNTGTGYGNGQHLGDNINPGPGPSYAYPNGPDDGQRGYLNEGRASAPDYYGPEDGAPAGAWRSQTQNPGVGADLVGPGSDMDNPTGAHDVSR